MMIEKKSLRLLAILLIVMIFSSLPTVANASVPSLGNFTYNDSYTSGQFGDVRGVDWFSPYVRDAVNYGLILGRGDGGFEPHGLLTIGEAVTLAARIHSIYYTGEANFEQSVPFYYVYVQYALAHGITYSHSDYTAPVSRAQFAKMIRNALPDSSFDVINEIPPFGINDVAYDTPTDKAVYSLFRAGILSGSDRFGTFFGSSNISRAETAAIMVRLVSPASRMEFSLPLSIPAEDLFSRSTDAIFRIDTYGPGFEHMRSGSGFFISHDGLAATALHVIDGSSIGSITTADGLVYRIAGIRAFDFSHNLAIIEIAADGKRFPYLTLADSDLVETGNTVYAIGTPRGMVNSMTMGIISHASRLQGEVYMLQFTAPISFGSGGGPVLNTLGQVVGIASLSLTHSQNMNLAIGSNHARAMSVGELITLEDFRLKSYQIIEW